MTRQYRPRFRKQLTGTPCGPANCNMAAAAMFADRQSLGIINVSPDQMREFSGTAGKCLDADPNNDGTNLRTAATALAHVGLHIELRSDIDWAAVVGGLDIGLSFIGHGDYDRVPVGLRGDKAFTGLHSVVFTERDAARGRILTYDGLDDARRSGVPQGPIWWPDHVVYEYLTAFPGVALTGAFSRRRMVRPIVRLVNIRDKPTRASAIIENTMQASGETFEYGGTVMGESIGGDRRWWRIWLPLKTRLGYVHASVVAYAGG